MKIVDRYIATNILSTTALVLLVLVAMDLFINVLNEVDSLGQGDYGISQAFIVAMLRMPQSAYQFFPIAGLIGGLLGLGSLAVNSELIVMRAAGVSISQITLAVMRAAIIIMIFVSLIGECLAPHMLEMADKHRAIAMSGGQIINTTEGLWIKEGNSFIFINHAEHHHLNDLQWFTLDATHQIQEAGAASSADYQHHHWYLTNATISHLANPRHVHSEKFTHMIWPIALKPRFITLSQAEPSKMSLLRLEKYIAYRNQNGLQARNYQLIFWQRIMQPFATLIMIFLAIPFIFGPLRSVTMGLRIVVGIAVGFIFYLINQLFGPFTILYQLPAFWSAALPVFVFAIIGIVLMWRTS